MQKRTHLEGGEMNDIVNVRVLGEDFIESRLIGKVGVVEGGSSAGQELDAVDDLFARRVVAIVDDNDLVASLDKGYGGERANVAGATILGSVR
jgi:hypothetical protein